MYLQSTIFSFPSLSQSLLPLDNTHPHPHTRRTRAPTPAHIRPNTSAYRIRTPVLVLVLTCVIAMLCHIWTMKTQSHSLPLITALHGLYFGGHNCPRGEVQFTRNWKATFIRCVGPKLSLSLSLSRSRSLSLSQYPMHSLWCKCPLFSACVHLAPRLRVCPLSLPVPLRPLLHRCPLSRNSASSTCSISNDKTRPLARTHARTHVRTTCAVYFLLTVAAFVLARCLGRMAQ